MKFKTTKKEINACYYAVSIGYCDLQDLLSHENAAAYTCGVYGWNADIYTFGNVAIVTGYRPFGIHIDYDIVNKYNKKARAIREDYTKDYETQKAELYSLIIEFIKEATGKNIAA